MKQGAFYTGKYRNAFAEAGYDEEVIESRKNEIFRTLFYGSDQERLYHPVGEDMGYIEDTGNGDVRTEGMSYGMMMCVQMNKKEEFDRLWKWARTYMYLEEGENAGYFAWSCGKDGTKNSLGAAPDGEEYFAMALLFAAHRFGNGKGIFNYEGEARELLHTCIHKGEGGSEGRSMWDPNNKLIRFITDVDFTDPSYHLPHFYELFGRWAKEEDRPFFLQAAQASRAYLKKACHPVTGLCAEYAEFDGSPYMPVLEIWGGRHDWYYSDAYRTIANIALDYEWFAADEWEPVEAKRLLSENRDAMDKIAEYLIQKETITGKEFMKIFREVKGIPEPEEKKPEESSHAQVKAEVPRPESLQPEKEQEEAAPLNAENTEAEQSGAAQNAEPENGGHVEDAEKQNEEM